MGQSGRERQTVVTIKAAIKAKIESVSEVSAAGIVVYLGMAPQRKDYPYAVLNRVGPGQYGSDMGGREPWAREVYQLDLYHTNDETLETIRNAVIAAVHAQGPVTWSTIKIYVALVTDGRDLTELEEASGEESVCRHELELTIKYEME